MLERIVICISNNGITIFELAKDHSVKLNAGSTDMKSLADLIAFNKADLYLVYMPEYGSQRCFTQAFPFISCINIGSLLNKTILEEKLNRYPLYKYYPSGKGGNKLYYSFACCDLSEELTQLIKHAGTLFKGVALPFIEYQGISRAIFDPNNRFSRDNILLVYSAPKNLDILRSNHKHVTLNVEHITLEQNTPTSIAGEILQQIETMNQDNESSNIAVIATKEINQIIKAEDKKNEIFALTPYEASILLKVDSFFKEDEQQGNLLFAANSLLGSSNNKMLLIPKSYETLIKQKEKNKKVSLSLIVLSVTVIFTILFCEIRINSTVIQNDLISKEVSLLNSVIENLKYDLNNYGEQSKEKIKLYRTFETKTKSPVDYLRKLDQQIDINKLELSYDNAGLNQKQKAYLAIEGRATTNEKEIIKTFEKDSNTNYEILLNGKSFLSQE